MRIRIDKIDGDYNCDYNTLITLVKAIIKVVPNTELIYQDPNFENKWFQYNLAAGWFNFKCPV